MSWYYNLIKNKQVVWSDFYIDKSFISMRMLYIKLIYLNDVFIGVVVVDLFFDDYKDMINKV